MRHDLSPELRRQFFQQQSPVVLVRPKQGSKTKAQRELEAIAREMAEASQEDTGTEESPHFDTAALITDHWGSKIGALGTLNDMICWAWVTPASREDRDYLMLALDVLQSIHPTVTVFPGQRDMQERLNVFFHSAPHRRPSDDDYERKSGNGQDPFAAIPVNAQMG